MSATETGEFNVDVGGEEDSEDEMSGVEQVEAPLVRKKKKRRRRSSSDEITLMDIVQDNKGEICVGCLVITVILCLILAFIVIPTAGEAALATAALAHDKVKPSKGSSPPSPPPAAPAVHKPEPPKPMVESLGKGYKQYQIEMYDKALDQKLKRSYVVFTPPEVQAHKPAVLVFRSDSGTFEMNSHWSGMDALAKEEGFLVVYPQGINGGSTHWNALGSGAGDKNTCIHERNNKKRKNVLHPTCKRAGHDRSSGICDMTACASDTEFVSAVLAHLIKDLGVDKFQIHATGQGLGGMMALQVGIKLSKDIASVVQVSGAPLVGYNEEPIAPVSLLSIRGSSDKIIPAFSGLDANSDEGWCPAGCDAEDLVSSDGYFYVPEIDVARTWAVSASCSELGKKRWHPSVQMPSSKVSWAAEFAKVNGKCERVGRSCASDAEIVSCTVTANHSFPWMRDNKWEEVAAKNLLFPRFAWSFMAAHPK